MYYYVYVKGPAGKKPQNVRSKSLAASETLREVAYNVAIDHVRGQGPIEVWALEEFAAKPEKGNPTFTITDSGLRRFKEAYYTSESDPNWENNTWAAVDNLLRSGNPSKGLAVSERVRRITPFRGRNV